MTGLNKDNLGQINSSNDTNIEQIYLLKKNYEYFWALLNPYKQENIHRVPVLSDGCFTSGQTCPGVHIVSIASQPAAPGSIPSNPKKISEEKLPLLLMLINGAG